MSRVAVLSIRRGFLAMLFLALWAPLMADLHLRTGGISTDTSVFSNLRFHRGDPVTTLNPHIFMSCNGLVVTEAANLVLTIPPSLNFEFDDVLPHATLSGPNAAQVDAPSTTGLAASFPDAGPEKRFFLNANVNFAVGNNFNVDGLRVRNFTATSAPTHLTLQIGAVTSIDSAWTMVANDPTASLPGGQATVSPGDATAPLGNIVIREANVTPGVGEPFNGAIWTSTDIRITIPAGVGVTWDSTVTTVGVDLPSKVGTTPNYSEDGGRTVRLAVFGSDFAQNEAVTVTGLRLNVAGSAADTQFNLSLRAGGAANTTAHDTIVNAVRIQGLSQMTSSGASLFTVGDPPSTNQTITVTDSSGTPKITTAGDVRILIPASFDMTWDSALPAPTAVVSGPGVGAVAATCLIEDLGKTLRVDVTADFAASKIVTISGARFANFTGREAAAGFLQLEVGAIAGPEDVDTRALRISRPSIASANDHIFLIAQGAATTTNQMTLTEDTVNPRIGIGTQIRLKTPVTSNIVFGGTNPVLSGNINGAISFEDPFGGGFRTMVLTSTAVFGAGTTATINSIPVIALSPASVGNFELFMSGNAAATVTNSDTALLVVGSLPTMSSGTTQQFTVNDPPNGVINLANPITITTDAGSAPLFQSGNSLEIVIPAALNLEWRTTIQPTSISGTASVKVAAGVTFPNAKTLRLAISADWATNDTLTLTGLEFANFTAACAPPGTSLQLRVRVGGPFAATDSQAKSIGAPTISSQANQVFGAGDPATVMSPITITDDPVTPRIRTGTNIRVRIPAGFNLTWVNPLPTLTVGAGPGTVGAPSFASGSVLLIPVTNNFGPGQTLGISGANFSIGAISPLDNLELEVNNTGSAIPNAFDNRTIKIGTRPTVTSVITGDGNGGQPNGSIDRLTVTFSEAIGASSQSVTTGLGFTVAGYNISLAAVGPANVLTLSLAETGLPDTGATPALVYVPANGDLADVNDSLELTAAIPATIDGAPPVIVSLTGNDTNSNGFLEQVSFTFSENLAGTPEISRWILVDADGSTNLLQGLTNGSFVIAGSTLNINLSDSIGTTGTPRFQYLSTGPGNILTDAAGNAVPTLTNNTPPVANAGPDQTVIPSVVTLDGSASFDPDGAQAQTYQWTEISRPLGAPAVVFTNGSTNIASFIPRIAGMYVLQLRVTDLITSTTDQVTVMVLNVAPTADPVMVITNIPTGVAVPLLTAQLSPDINGDLTTLAPNQPVWTLVSKPATSAATLTSPNNIFAPGLTPDVPGSYELSIVVKDGAGNASAPASAFVVANGGGVVTPVANAGPDLVVPTGTAATLHAGLSWSLNPGPTFTWTRPDTSTATGQTLSFTPPGVGLYTFKLTVTDTVPAVDVVSAPDTVTVMAYDPSNLPPLAFASKLSPAGVPVVGQSITLDSTGSLDPEGATLAFAWTQVSGPTAFVSNPAAARPTFAPAIAGVYEFQLTVFDGAQLSFPARVIVQVIPTAATAPVTISGTASGTPGDVAGHLASGSPITLTVGPLVTGISNWWWEQVGGPTITFVPNGTLNANPTFTPTVAGTYSFRVTALNFGANIHMSSTVSVVVDQPAAGNDAPNASAGPAQSGIASGSTVSLDGTGSSADATTFFWSQVAGPPVALSDAHASQPTFVPTAGGTYAFQLIVSDGTAASAPSIVNVAVDPPSTPPPASGGGGSGGGCGLCGEPLILLGLAALLRRRARR